MWLFDCLNNQKLCSGEQSCPTFYLSGVNMKTIKLSNCQICSKEFIIGPGCTGKYCSIKCSHLGLSTTLKNIKSNEVKDRMLSYNLNPNKCRYCTSIIEYKMRNKKIFCNSSCSARYRCKQNNSLITDEKRLYWMKCEFKFSPYSYPAIPGYTLLLEKGLYNNNTNIDGISRDHMYSIANGWKNKIDPTIISHPANCNLIPQQENRIKWINCSITYQELLERINRFKLER